jgi:hypothetical protein
MDKAAQPPPEPSDGVSTNPAQLKAAIDAGRTGDKAAALDPAAAPLGTDEEAAGTPAGPWAVSQAHEAEHSRAAAEAQSPDLADNTVRKPGVGMGLMIGVVVALLLAALLAWVVLGQSVLS